MKKLYIFVLALILFLVGCATENNNDYQDNYSQNESVLENNNTIENNTEQDALPEPVSYYENETDASYIDINIESVPLFNTQNNSSNGIEFVETTSMGQETFNNVLIFHRGGSVVGFSPTPPWAESFSLYGNAIIRYSEHILDDSFNILQGTIGRVSRRNNFVTRTGHYNHDVGEAVIQFIGDGQLLKEIILEDITENASDRTITNPELVVTQNFEIDVTGIHELNIIVYIRQLGMRAGNIVRLEIGICGTLQ